MHYRNGREAKNGDRVVQIGAEGRIVTTGVLRDAVAGNDYCNGYIMPITTDYSSPSPLTTDPIACMCDCLHANDVAILLAEKGLDKRPPGK
jgi:hypothetical protein